MWVIFGEWGIILGGWDVWGIILDEVGVGGKIFWVGGGGWGEVRVGGTLSWVVGGGRW